MDNPTQDQKCADLARAMGWKIIQHPDNFFQLITPEGLVFWKGWPSEKTEGKARFSSELQAWASAPNPFAFAADSRALVMWLANCGSRVQLSFVYVITGRRDGYHYGNIIDAMTAPLPVIAEAAWRAIQPAK